MKQFLRNSGPYLAAYALLLVGMAAALWAMPKDALHLWLNGHHTAGLDAFFRLFTRWAEWPLYALMLGVMLKRYDITAYYALAEVSATVVVQVVKWAANMPRPITYFADSEAFQQIMVEGVRMHRWHSFPSGHTQTFFVFATVVALLIANRAPLQPWLRRWVLPLLMLCFASLGGYSRIYLSQHFLLDVCVGSLIAVAIVAALWPAYERFERRLGHRGILCK